MYIFYIFFYFAFVCENVCGCVSQKNIEPINFWVETFPLTKGGNHLILKNSGTL